MPIDVDSARAVRREALGHTPSVIVDGKEYELPPELSIATVELLDSFGTPDDFETMKKLLPLLFGDKAEEIEGRISVSDAFFIFKGLLKEYGLSAGNSAASAKSSKSSGTKRRQPSKPSTESTSDEPRTDPPLLASAASGS